MFGPNLQEIWDALPEDRRQRIEDAFLEKALYIASQQEGINESTQQ